MATAIGCVPTASGEPVASVPSDVASALTVALPLLTTYARIPSGEMAMPTGPMPTVSVRAMLAPTVSYRLAAARRRRLRLPYP